MVTAQTREAPVGNGRAFRNAVRKNQITISKRVRRRLKKAAKKK